MKDVTKERCPKCGSRHSGTTLTVDIRSKGRQVVRTKRTAFACGYEVVNGRHVRWYPCKREESYLWRERRKKLYFKDLIEAVKKVRGPTRLRDSVMKMVITMANRNGVSPY